MILYHITNVENVESIKKNGLKVNEEGELFLFDGVDYNYPFCIIENGDRFHIEKHWVGVDRLIARNQLFMNEYAVFCVDVPSKYLKKDDVAELTADSQFIYPYNIPPHKVEYVKTVKLNEKLWE